MSRAVTNKLALISSALFFAVGGSASAASVVTSVTSTANDNNAAVSIKRISFGMVVSQVANTCLPNASAQVSIQSSGAAEAEDMFISVTGLPPNTDFDFFVIQVPNAPFGLSWYQGDLQTDDNGSAMQHFRGRFSIETFIIAPGVAPARQVFIDPAFPDALQNPKTVGPDGNTPGPVQTYHLGLWFNSPIDAQNAGCPNTVTPFNGEHNAGIQVLNTATFPDTQGPLLKLRP